MTPDEVRDVVLAFPGVEEAVSLGSIAFRVKGKVLARLGARTGPDDLMLTDIGADEAEMLIAAAPAVFHATPHFTDARCLLARLAALDAETLRPFIERRWRKIAGRAAVSAWEATR